MKNLRVSAKGAMIAPFVCAAALGLVLAGCGGSGGKKSSPTVSSSAAAAATGRARFTIKWPAPASSRLVPDLSNSIVVEVVRDGAVFDKKLIARPTDPSVPSVVTFDPLPVGNLTLRATAYPKPDGTGVAQATGAAPLLIADGQETDFGTLTMGTTIDTISVAPPNAAAAAPSVGSPPQTWTATAKDASGAIILFVPAKQKWESSNPSVATVSSTGLVTPVSAGTATIKETDEESGKSGSRNITVSDAKVTISQFPVLTKFVRVVIWKRRTVIDGYPNAPYKIVTGAYHPDTDYISDTTVSRANNEASLTVPLSPVDGTYQVQASAFASQSGSETAMATQAAEVTVTGGKATLALPLGSMVYSLTVTPSASNVEVLHGQTKSLTVTSGSSYDYGTVPVDASEISWASSNPSVASVSPAGLTTTVTMVDEGTVSITATHIPTGKGRTLTNAYKVVGAVKPQFKPADYALPGGSLSLTDGHTYQFDTGAASAPTLTDTTNGTVAATGQYVTQTVGATTAIYAVFAWAGDVHIGNATTVTAKGSAALVLLAQGSVLLDGGVVLDVSAVGATPGAGGAVPGSGPGAGAKTYHTTIGGGTGGPGGGQPGGHYTYGGGSFGGLGGNGSSVYGINLANGVAPYLQGGSGSYSGGAGGGALYLACQGTLTLNGASIKGRGGDGTEGGSGGALVLLGGGGVSFSQATLDAGGGKNGGTTYHGGGGGGRIVIAYGAGASPDLSLVKAAGGTGSSTGADGKIYVDTFNGF